MVDGVNFWLSECGQLGIVENSNGDFEAFYRKYSSLENHDYLWFSTYTQARNYLKNEHQLQGRLKQVNKEDFK